MIKFKDYIGRQIRKGMIFTWITLSIVVVIAYTTTMFFLKEKQITSSLRVAAITIRDSMEAGDWNLALNHLMMLESNGPIFDIQLSNKIDLRNKLTGPFGKRPLGIGQICKTEMVAEDTKLNGCMVLFGIEEIITFILFIVFASGLSIILIKVFSDKSLKFIEAISNELKGMRELSASEPSQNADQITEIASIREYILLLLNETKEASKAIATSQLSAQVAHDIRSPLTVLDMTIHDIKDIPEDKRILIRNAVRRIHDIANNLLQHYVKSRHDEDYTTIESESFLISMLDPIFSEKRLQYKYRNIKFDLAIKQDSYSLFSKVNRIEFMRMISNLIDNAVEAISHQNGCITVSLSNESGMASIKVIDNGCGVPEDILSNLLSHNIKEIGSSKKDGHGLGLLQTYSVIKSINGNFNIESMLGHGTTVTIRLPLSMPPIWLISQIKIKPSQTIIVFDDDLSIHDVWRHRLNHFLNRHQIKIKHFSSPEKLQNWIHNETNKLTDCLFLMDYEISDSTESGLDLIKTFQIQSNSILVTNCHEEQNVIDQCKALGVSILPKSIVAFIPIALIEDSYF